MENMQQAQPRSGPTNLSAALHNRSRQARCAVLALGGGASGTYVTPPYESQLRARTMLRNQNHTPDFTSVAFVLRPFERALVMAVKRTF